MFGQNAAQLSCGKNAVALHFVCCDPSPDTAIGVDATGDVAIGIFRYV